MRARDLWSDSALAGALGVVCLLACSNHAAVEPAVEGRVTLLHTSDLHSRVWPFRSRTTRFEAELGLGREAELDEVGGFARLATLLEAERQRAPAAVWLDSGDALEGAEIFHRHAGKPEIELLGALGLAAMALGNHELSLSAAELAERAAEARFPLLAANLWPRAGSPLVGRLAASALVPAGGVWLGVIGVANPRSPPSLTQPRNAWQLDVAQDAAAAVQTAIDEIAARAALIIVLSHLGLDEDRALVARTSGIDLLLGGHQHLVTAEPEWEDDCQTAALRSERGCEARRVPIVHSGAYGKWLSRLELALVQGGTGFEVASLELAHLPASADVSPSPRVVVALEGLELPPAPPLAFAPGRIARQAALGGDAPLGNLSTDAARRQVGADVVLLNSSGLRADLERGLVTRTDLELVFPFAEPWRQGLVPGAALLRGLSRAARKSAARQCVSALQVSGLRLRLRCSGCSGADCVEALEGDSRLDEQRLLQVALPEYLASAGADFEELLALTEPLELDFATAVRDIAVAPAADDADACASAMRGLSALGCRAAFGPAGCPVAEEQARALCAALPRLSGRRDDRVQMLP